MVEWVSWEAAMKVPDDTKAASTMKRIFMGIRYENSLAGAKNLPHDPVKSVVL